MEDWNRFSDPRFALEFRYPAQTAAGESVKRVQTQHAGMIRIHILAPDSREIYFEVTRYDLLSAEFEYRRHKTSLLKQLETVVINQLSSTSLGVTPAYEYSFQWDQGARVVLLFERVPQTYRILYNPRSPVNRQILSTVEWLNPP